MKASVENIHTQGGASRSEPPPGRPDDVLRDTSLSLPEKRALLAAWASDANAVANPPSLRKLDDGPVVPVDDILNALRSLDEAYRPVDITGWRSKLRLKGSILSYVHRMRSGSDDDDDPPPCPAAAGIPIPTRPLEAVAA